MGCWDRAIEYIQVMTCVATRVAPGKGVGVRDRAFTVHRSWPRTMIVDACVDHKAVLA